VGEGLGVEGIEVAVGEAVRVDVDVGVGEKVVVAVGEVVGSDVGSKVGVGEGWMVSSTVGDGLGVEVGVGLSSPSPILSRMVKGPVGKSKFIGHSSLLCSAGPKAVFVGSKQRKPVTLEICT
jgi:hypothetical protein